MESMLITPPGIYYNAVMRVSVFVYLFMLFTLLNIFILGGPVTKSILHLGAQFKNT